MGAEITGGASGAGRDASRLEVLPADAALLVIDVQRGFENPAWGPRNNPLAESNIGRLLDGWRRSGRPVIHVHHHSTEPGSPLRPGQAGAEPMDVARPAPGELVLSKQVNSALIGTGLEEHLRSSAITVLVAVGLTTNHCVSTTVRMAANLGWRTFVVADATATFDRVDHEGKRYPAEEVHAISLASLHDEFATVVDTDQLLAAL